MNCEKHEKHENNNALRFAEAGVRSTKDFCVFCVFRNTNKNVMII